MDTLPDFLSCKKSLSVISFHIFTKPHPPPPSPPLFSWVWAGSPCSRWIHCKTEGLRQSLKKGGKGNRERQNSNKQDCVCIQKLVILCLSMCPIKGLNTADIKA